MFSHQLFRSCYILLALFIPASLFCREDKIFVTYHGAVHFRSDAPQELIRAESEQLWGAIEAGSKHFTFKIRISTFEGFNSGLQRIHFNENYLQSALYPEASFKGKIIEDIDFTTEGRFEIRAKGILIIHGVEQERIIKSELIVRQGKLYVQSNFTVQLPDHNIPIPRIVKDKLAQEIKVEIRATLEIK